MTFDEFYTSLVAQNDGDEDGLNKVQLMAAFNAGFDRGYNYSIKIGFELDTKSGEASANSTEDGV